MFERSWLDCIMISCVACTYTYDVDFVHRFFELFVLLDRPVVGHRARPAILFALGSFRFVSYIWYINVIQLTVCGCTWYTTTPSARVGVHARFAYTAECQMMCENGTQRCLIIIIKEQNNNNYNTYYYYATAYARVLRCKILYVLDNNNAAVTIAKSTVYW